MYYSKKNIFIMLPFMLYNVHLAIAQGKDIETVYSSVHMVLYPWEEEKGIQNIEEYKIEEPAWAISSVPIAAIGKVSTSSSLPNYKDIHYQASNLEDYDLNTAWIVKNYGIGECIEFTFEFAENTTYGWGGEYNGICNLFNGYCKSEALWKANSRVKKLKVYYNNTPLCYVELVDTWHMQSFDISKFFIDRDSMKNLDAKYEIVNGDILKFEIVEVYKGTKYKDVAISEFLGEASAN